MYFILRAIRYFFRKIGFAIMTRAEMVRWRLRNRHNKTRMGNYFPSESVSVGNWTYGELNVHHFDAPNEGLTIGNYCSIGPDVEFFMGGSITHRIFQITHLVYICRAASL